MGDPTPERTITHVLERDHRQLDALFEAVKSSAQAGVLAEAGRRLVEFSGRLQRHMDCEEALLFPLFEPKQKRIHGTTFTLRAEHQELIRLMEEMADALAAERAHVFSRFAEEFEGTLAQHNAREEQRFYPDVDAGQTDPERAALLAKIEPML